MSGVSVATIKSPEFINITSVSPLISSCEVKVLYVGQNRNHSFITKEVATEMAKSLPGTPIVGYYSEKEEDFRDHGSEVVINGDGIQFNCLTKPYGFVPTDTKVWFKEFEDTDDFGNKITREYLMCQGYLWTQQYQEAQKIISEGRPHSMELDEESLKGHWSTDTNSGIEFFIINDAIFSKLCILGEDVEPCFEGSSITAPEVSSSFSCDNKDFTKTLYTMMKELKEFTYSLQGKGGETSMEDTNVNVDNLEASTEEVVEETFTNSEDKDAQIDTSNNQDSVEDTFEKKKDEDDSDDEENKEEKDDSEETDDDKEEDDDDEDKKKPSKNTLEEDYATLEDKYNQLSQEYSLLQAQNEELIQFKTKVEDKEKDKLIESFYMLSDEDKKDVIEHKSEYTFDEIKSKLSVICFDKKVSFDNREEDADEQPAFIYNLGGDAEEDSLPEWLKAVKRNRTRN